MKGNESKKKKTLPFFWEIHQLWNLCSTVCSKPFTLNENCHFIIIVIRSVFHLTNTRNSHPQSPRNVPMSPYTFFCVIGPWEGYRLLDLTQSLTPVLLHLFICHFFSATPVAYLTQLPPTRTRLTCFSSPYAFCIHCHPYI